MHELYDPQYFRSKDKMIFFIFISSNTTYSVVSILENYIFIRAQFLSGRAPVVESEKVSDSFRLSGSKPCGPKRAASVTVQDRAS